MIEEDSSKRGAVGGLPCYSKTSPQHLSYGDSGSQIVMDLW